ncbi:hypothetical protein PoB_002141400 [Plakobranchus ocellatus]|uniref:Uncharacterized protein n=1 Tax=Plakobranchus ocellatus TaxID=259542 RepID=A0AAV3ZKM9_9GAST|nr:hypothetical protein PoB_002141400 [Plakobranchus ocellatus]
MDAQPQLHPSPPFRTSQIMTIMDGCLPPSLDIGDWIRPGSEREDQCGPVGIGRQTCRNDLLAYRKPQGLNAPTIESLPRQIKTTDMLHSCKKKEIHTQRTAESPVS